MRKRLDFDNCLEATEEEKEERALWKKLIEERDATEVPKRWQLDRC